MAAADQYTHRISFKIGDGGQFIVADVSFDDQGVPEADIISSSKPLSLSLFEDFKSLAEMIGKIVVKGGGVKSISVRERGYNDPDAKRS